MEEQAPPLAARDTDKDAVTGAVSALVGSYTDKLSSVNTTGVLRQALMMGGAAGAALAVYFLLLRPYLPHILAPRSKLRDALAITKDEKETETDEKASKKGKKTKLKRLRNRESWLQETKDGIKHAIAAILQPEEHHLLQSGLDSVAYLRLLQLNMTSFALITATVFPLLSVVDWKAHNKGKLWANVKVGNISLKDSGATTNLSQRHIQCFMMCNISASASASSTTDFGSVDFTITGVKDTTLYWHVGSAYITTTIILGLILYNSHKMERRRVTFFTNPALLNRPKDIYKQCVMIADIGKHERESVQDEIKKKMESIQYLKGEKYVTKVFEVQDPEGRERRMAARDQLVAHLQRVVTHFIEDRRAGKDVGPEPIIRRPGSLALGGPKVQALRYFKEEMQSLDKNYPIGDFKHWYAFIGFNCAGNVSLFLRHIASPAGKIAQRGWDMDFAPTPSGIIWRNIKMNHGIRATSYLVGYMALVVLLVVYTPPLAFIALLSNVAAVTKWSPMLKKWSTESPILFTIVTTLSASLFSLLPKIIEFVAHWQGAKTTRSLQNRTIHWYLAFLVLSQLVILPSLSTIFTLVTRETDPKSKKAKETKLLLKIWVDIIYFFTQMPDTYQQQANYWLNWLALRWFLVSIQLAQASWLFREGAVRLWRAITAQEKVVEIAPAEYSIRIPQNMFLTVVGVLYAPLVPFVPAFLLVALTFQYCIHAVQARDLFMTKSETTARFWLPEMDRLMLFLLLSHGNLALTCALQKADGILALAMIPACGMIVIFRIYLRARFNNTLLLMLHEHALVKTATEDISIAKLDAIFGFQPRGKKLIFKEEVREDAETMLKRAGLFALVEIDDEYIEARGKKDPLELASEQAAERKRQQELAGKTAIRIKGKGKHVIAAAKAVNAFAQAGRSRKRAADAPPDPFKEMVDDSTAIRYRNVQAGITGIGSGSGGVSGASTATAQTTQGKRRLFQAVGAVARAKKDGTI